MTWATTRAYTTLLPGLVEGLKENGPEPVHRGVKSLGWQYHATCMGSHGAPNFRHVWIKCQTYVHWGKTRVLSDNFRAYIEKSGFEHPNSRTSLLSAECSLGVRTFYSNCSSSPTFCISGRRELKCTGKVIDTLSCQHVVLGISAQGAIPATDLRLWRQKVSKLIRNKLMRRSIGMRRNCTLWLFKVWKITFRLNHHRSSINLGKL